MPHAPFAHCRRTYSVVYALDGRGRGVVPGDHATYRPSAARYRLHTYLPCPPPSSALLLFLLPHSTAYNALRSCNTFSANTTFTAAACRHHIRAYFRIPLASRMPRISLPPLCAAAASLHRRYHRTAHSAAYLRIRTCHLFPTHTAALLPPPCACRHVVTRDGHGATSLPGMA